MDDKEDDRGSYRFKLTGTIEVLIADEDAKAFGCHLEKAIGRSLELLVGQGEVLSNTIDVLDD